MISHTKHKTWCWNNGIYFSPQAIDSYGNYVKIVMVKNGKEKLGEEKFPQKTHKDKDALYKKIDDLYLEVFNKNI